MTQKGNERFIVIDAKDNVATSLCNAIAGKTVDIMLENDIFPVKVIDSINFGHKVAIKSIAKGENIIKYGEVIGIASLDIAPGEHVHVHNIKGNRARGDLQVSCES